MGDSNICVHKVGDNSWEKKAILLHGNPSHSGEWRGKFPALTWMQVQVFCIDQPGFGNSTGKQRSCRSDKVMDKDGPADVVKFIIRQLGLKKPILYGYDWGAGIAMKLAIQSPGSYSKIVALTPSFNEDTPDELKKLKTPTLIQWAVRDEMHSWTKWKNLVKKIPNVTVQALDPRPWDPSV